MKYKAKLILGVLIVLGVLGMSQGARAQVAVGISVHIGPPALPVYPQPVCPGPGYIWTPGYWAYGDEGYYWVPGTWVVAPAVGLLWTPGYWGWAGGVYVWHAGYWGPHVGFYGGINYGFGYGGVGFVGGEWRGGVYHYNTAVTNINTTIIHNTYRTTVINNATTVSHVSYNGGTGGITARPTPAEMAAEREHHTPATHLQTQHEQSARSNREFLASQNHGHPAVAATAKPGQFHGAGVVSAHGSNASHAEGNKPQGGNMRAARDDRPPSAGGPRSSGMQNSKAEVAHGNDSPHSRNAPRGNGSHGEVPHEGAAPHGNSGRPPHESEGHGEGHGEGGKHPGGGKL
jgi:WXXGXW repeat (2 copies)